MAVKLPIPKKEWDKLSEREKRKLIREENKKKTKKEVNDTLLAFVAAGYLVGTIVERKQLINSIKIRSIRTPIAKDKWNKLTTREKKTLINKERNKIENKQPDLVVPRSLRKELTDDGWAIVRSTWLVAIRRVGINLDVRFKSGIILRYPGYGEVFDEMNRAVSKGAYGHANLIFTRRSLGGAAYIQI
jgi:hypothetical protein